MAGYKRNNRKLQFGNMKQLIAFCGFLILHTIAAAQPGMRTQFPDMGRQTPTSDPSDLYNRGSNPLTYMRDDNQVNWQQRHIVTQQVLTFAGFFDDRLVDSFWQELRNVKPTSNTSHFINFETTSKPYLVLFNKIYGDSFELSVEKKLLKTDTFLQMRSAEVLYKARSSKDQGFLNLVFDITEDAAPQLVLHKITFIPFDHSQNDFVNNLCEPDLGMIKSGQISSLLDNIDKYSVYSLKNEKQLAKKLGNMKLSSNSLFTSRLMMIKDKDLWVIGIYDTDKSDERLLLGHKLIDKRFKPALIELIKKE
jgi:hypothetical protein